MAKVMFIPVSILGGLVAGLVAKKAFEVLWGVVDSEEPPEPEHREVALAKLVTALALEGAIFRAVRGLSDHLARGAFHRASGVWPGEERPEPETA
jgi:hypothetical protein